MGEFCLCHALVFTAQWSKKSFYQIKTLAVFQDENKSDLEHVTISETDIISKRKPMLLKLFLKRYPVCVLSFLCANLHIGRTVM